MLIQGHAEDAKAGAPLRLATGAKERERLRQQAQKHTATVQRQQGSMLNTARKTLMVIAFFRLPTIQGAASFGT